MGSEVVVVAADTGRGGSSRRSSRAGPVEGEWAWAVMVVPAHGAV